MEGVKKEGGRKRVKKDYMSCVTKICFKYETNVGNSL